MKKIAVLAVIAVLALVGLSFGATFTNVVGTASGGYAAVSPVNAYGQAITLNFAATPVASNDVVQLINVKSNSLVVAVEYDVMTTNTDAAIGMRTFTVGDSGSAARYHTGISMGSVAGAASAASVWHLYTANGTIDLTALDDFSNGTVRVRAWMIDLSR
jgi:hypothetical protein